MSKRFNIFLMGPRACGKTTLGRMLAETLGWTFVDLDDVALARFSEGTISSVWERHGEPAWREAEVAALEELLKSGRQIVALGGGTPMIPAARDRLERVRMSGGAWLIYLKVDAETLRQRLEAEAGDRPSLTGGDVAAEVAEVLRKREPRYLALADLVFDATGDLESAQRRLFEAMPEAWRKGRSLP